MFLWPAAIQWCIDIDFLYFIVVISTRHLFSEPYTDHSEKRRKRGSLFFRKKKDKSKSKGQANACDRKFLTHSNQFNVCHNCSWLIHVFIFFVLTDCGSTVNPQNYKEHVIECKAKLVKVRFFSHTFYFQPYNRLEQCGIDCLSLCCRANKTAKHRIRSIRPAGNTFCQIKTLFSANSKILHRTTLWNFQMHRDKH